MSVEQIDLKSIIGVNYDAFWSWRGRYRVLKGGRASKKSTNTANWYIYHLLKYPKSNLLCVRRIANTLKDSCFAELKTAAKRMKVYDKFKFTVSPLEITVIATGQKVLFRGMDNPDSLTSINVSEGALCWVWIEEAFEIDNEDDFNKLDECVRGLEIEKCGLFPQITLTMNPWSEMWIKDRFFDSNDPRVLAQTRNYFHNEFLTDADYANFRYMKEHNPERYKIAGLGEWGQPGGSYFSEFDTSIHVVQPFVIPDDWRIYRTLDYGLDMLACLWIAVSPLKEIYIIKEIALPDMTISNACKKIEEYTTEKIYLTYAPPDLWGRSQESGKSRIDIFADNGLYMTKSSNDRVAGWLAIKELLQANADGVPTLKIFANCTELIRCLKSIQHDEKNPTDCATQPHDITHVPDALRYFAVQWYNAPSIPKNKTALEKYRDKVLRPTNKRRRF